MRLTAASLVAIVLLASPAALLASGRLVLSVVDRETGKPVAARVHLKNAHGKVIRPPGALVWGDHFVIFDKIALKLPNGGYEFTIERGLEYRIVTGHFNIENFADDTKTVELTRFVDMAKDGWYSGDLDVQRPDEHLQLLMRADDLHVVPLLTWSKKSNPWNRPGLPVEPTGQFDGDYFYNLMGGNLSTPGNPLHVFRMLGMPGDEAERQLKSVGTADGLGTLPILPWIERMRRERNFWVDAGAMTARDLPIWIAAGVVDSIELADARFQRDGLGRDVPGSWLGDKTKYGGAQGLGHWSQEIYYHLLNCGLRIPPTAGSGSGANPNPVGYNRVYVHALPFPQGEDLGEGAAAPAKSITWDDWWTALRAGRVSVTNGPLLRPVVEGQYPGHEFRGQPGQTLELLVGLTLSTRDKISYLEIVKDGQVVEAVNLEQFKAAGGKLPPLQFTDSGWFLIRAVADNDKTYRFASTAPYYVDFNYQKRISRASAQFFLDWTNRRAEEVAAASEKEASQEAQIALQYIDRAQAYWQSVLEKATAE